MRGLGSVAAARLEGPCETRPGTDLLRSGARAGAGHSCIGRGAIEELPAPVTDSYARSSNGGNRCLDDFAGEAALTEGF